MDKAYILSEIRRTAEANGGRGLGQNQFVTETGIRIADWRGKHWARWNEALVEAGCPQNSRNVRIQDSEILHPLALFVREIRRFPSPSDLRLRRRRDAQFPSFESLHKRWKMEQLKVAVLEFCERTQGLDDVAEICRSLVKDANTPAEPEAAKSDIEIGFVYLMKSGKHYKLGRSNAPGRREYELGIQLPEKLVKIHEIKTDDPVGIEAYWHNRFADKRLNGEWFNLTAADIHAFKRRKFM